MDKQTFVSRIKGKIDYGSMPTSLKNDQWVNPYRNGQVLLYIFSKASVSIKINDVNKVNPPTSKASIEFIVNGKNVETISDTLANQALSALPYKPTTGYKPGLTYTDEDLPKDAKDWLARNAGKNNCFVSSGVTFYDELGNAHTGGTGNVLSELKVLGETGNRDAPCVNGKSYNDFISETSVTTITYDAIGWVLEHDSPSDPEGQYCIGAEPSPPKCFVSFDKTSYSLGDEATCIYTNAPSGSTMTLKKPDGTVKQTWSVSGNGSKASVLDVVGTWTLTLTGTDCSKTSTTSVTTTAPSPVPEYMVTIKSSPSAASIKLDGKKTYKLTPETFRLSKGEHDIELSKEGYKDYSTTINVTRDNTYTYTLEPEKETAPPIEIEVTRGGLGGSVSISSSRIPQTIAVTVPTEFRIHVDNPATGVHARYRVTLTFSGVNTYSFTSDWSDIVAPDDYTNLYVTVTLPDAAIPTGQASAVYTLISTLEGVKA